MDIFPEMMVLDSNMLCPRSKLGTGGNLDAALIIFPNFAFEYRSASLNIEDFRDFFQQI